MKVLVVDNYDSFTYNLVYILKELGAKVTVKRNDKFRLEEAKDFDKILLSPGPGVPSEAGLMPNIIKEYASSKSILGVCLGHQGIAESFGARLENMKDVFHGIASNIEVENSTTLFKNINKQFKACRYHSWTVIPDTIPAELEITAVDGEGRIMALQHTKFAVFGVQFHPESILTENGKKIVENWLKS